MAELTGAVGRGLSQDRGALGNQGLCSFGLPAHPKPIRRYLYTINHQEQLAEEVKRRTKVVEVFCEEDAVAKLLYIILSQLDEAEELVSSEDLRKSRF